MTIFYYIATQAYYLAIRLAAFFSPKARRWQQGRTDLFQKLEQDFQTQKTEKQPLVWVHCASLGEFEQGRPLIEALKKERPKWKLLLTFFSPSGYDIRKNYPLADWVHYLPADSPANARRFFDLTRPSLILFVKYEFWHYYLSEAKRRGVPLYLVSAIFRQGQPFFQWYGGFHRRMLGCFTSIMVQDSASVGLLAGAGFQKVALTGDTRVDRVLQIAAQPFHDEVLDAFCTGQNILVCGSTWDPDERLLAQAAPQLFARQWKIVLAPHEVGSAHVQAVERLFGAAALPYSEAKKAPATCGQFSVLIIDNMGMLSSLYRYGKLAWIGGGFGSGIHNTLEPAAYGLPVFFGGNFRKFREAVVMTEAGGAFCVTSAEAFMVVFEKLTEESAAYEKAKQAVLSFIGENKGATEKTLGAI